MSKKSSSKGKAKKIKKESIRNIEKLEQLSVRHEVTLKKLLHLEKQVDEKLEQLSQRHNASIDKINALGKSIDEKLEQLSERHAAVVRKTNSIKKRQKDTTSE